MDMYSNMNMNINTDADVGTARIAGQEHSQRHGNGH
jgi:hypothetical protein